MPLAPKILVHHVSISTFIPRGFCPCFLFPFPFIPIVVFSFTTLKYSKQAPPANLIPFPVAIIRHCHSLNRTILYTSSLSQKFPWNSPQHLNDTSFRPSSLTELFLYIYIYLFLQLIFKSTTTITYRPLTCSKRPEGLCFSAAPLRLPFPNSPQHSNQQHRRNRW